MASHRTSSSTYLSTDGGLTWGIWTAWQDSGVKTWTPPQACDCRVKVWARSAGVTTDAAQAEAQLAYVINTPPPAAVTSATLGASLASPQNTGMAVTFTAGAAGGVGPHEYKFFVRQGSGSYEVARSWSTTATYTWTPAIAASYTVTVWARSAGVTTDAAQAAAHMAYVINTPPAPVTSASLTPNVASPQNTGTAVTFTAGAAGGVGPHEYKFFVRQGSGSYEVARSWSTTATYTWTPAIAASYTVTVWARSAGVTTDAAQAAAHMAYVINTPPAPVTSASLTPNVASPQNTGTAVTFTAGAAGGVGPHEYKFFVRQGSGSYEVARSWSTTATYTWTPAIAASYTVTVWARSAGVTTDAAQAAAHLNYSVTAASGPLSITSLTSNVASPQVTGTTVTFSAVASGGLAPYQFKWWVFDGSAWRVGQDWGTSATFNWRPTTAGDYMVAVWARNKGVKANASEALAQVPYKVTGTASTAPLSITSFTSNLISPQVTGTTITFQAVATGGEAPYQFKWWVYRRFGVESGTELELERHTRMAANNGRRLHGGGLGAEQQRDHRRQSGDGASVLHHHGCGNASAAGDDQPDQQRGQPGDAWDVGHVYGCGIGRSGSVPIQVVGIRRCRMEGRAGLEPECHIQLATDSGRGLHGRSLGAEQRSQLECQPGDGAGVLYGDGNGIERTTIDQQFHEQPGKPAGGWERGDLLGSSSRRLGPVSIQMVGLRRYDVAGRAELEHERHVQLASHQGRDVYGGRLGQERRRED